jgi:hypothetical protein
MSIITMANITEQKKKSVGFKKKKIIKKKKKKKEKKEKKKSKFAPDCIRYGYIMNALGLSQ